MEVVVLVDDSVFVSPDGDEESIFVVFVSVLDVPRAGDGFTIVVLFSVFFSAGAGATVSVFCSQAARSAAPARMQIYFFIFGWVSRYGLKLNRSGTSAWPCL